MKKLICFALMLFVLIPLASCEEKTDESKTESQTVSSTIEVGSLTDIVKDLCVANSLTKGNTYTSESSVTGEYLDVDMISSYYGSMFDAPDFSLISEYCVYIEDFDTNLRIEIGIFKVIDSNNNVMVKDFLELRKENIVTAAINYPAVDAEPFKNVVIETIGNYTYYIAVKENRDNINNTIRQKLGA